MQLLTKKKYCAKLARRPKIRTTSNFKTPKSSFKNV